MYLSYLLSCAHLCTSVHINNYTQRSILCTRCTYFIQCKSLSLKFEILRTTSKTRRRFWFYNVTSSFFLDVLHTTIIFLTNETYNNFCFTYALPTIAIYLLRKTIHYFPSTFIPTVHSPFCPSLVYTTHLTTT